MRISESSQFPHLRRGAPIALAVALIGCIAPGKGGAATPDDAAFFQEYIEPLLESHCYDCHSHDAGEASGGLVLDSKAGWSIGGDSGPAIVPGDASASLLWRAVSYEEAGLEMPPDGKLDENQLLLIKKWIELGAVDPREGGQAAEKKQIDIEAGKQWWAFQPIRAQQAPESLQGVSRIDRFLDSHLQDAGIEKAALATRATLIRRVTYDLTGLPPSWEMAGSSSELTEQQYADYVDQLLDSEAFGEKWGRHWLDVVRYADSNGSSFNVPFHDAWRYRNWVIDAINRNLPIDQFLAKQLAGDLLPAESDSERDENLIATGYWMLGSKVLGTFDKEQLFLDVIDEQVDTLGKSLLGMTLGCARCHDHKFDPVPQADYYALAGILGSTSTLVDRIGGPKDDESDWQRRGLGPGGDERLVAFLENHRYDWVKAVRKRFQATKKLDALKDKRQLEETGAVASEELLNAQRELQDAESELRELLSEMPPHAMGVREAEEITDLEVRIRGVASSRGDRVARGFLQVASFSGQPSVPQGQSGRLELARWITSPDNPLTARVFVNRVWKHLFREGLVRSVDNFGTTGEKPSHPELLDDLAYRFANGGWNLKSLVREVVLSQAYRRAVAPPNAIDPDNRLLAHQNRRRLEAEEIRDSLLALSGHLVPGQGEGMLESLPIGDVSDLGEYLKIQDHRRTIYQPVIRTLEPDILQLFDAAGNAMVTGSRPRTIVAPQSLYFLNSQFVQDCASAVGSDILERHLPTGQLALSQDQLPAMIEPLINDVYQVIVCREPTPKERSLLRDYLLAQADGDPGLTRHDMLKLCQAIIGSTQFQFLD